MQIVVKFIYSERATKFCEIFTLLLTGTTKDKSKVNISKIFVAFSEYMNFTNNQNESRIKCTGNWKIWKWKKEILKQPSIC